MAFAYCNFVATRGFFIVHSSVGSIFEQQLCHDLPMIGDVGFTAVQVVVQAVDFAYLGGLVARLGVKFFGDEDVVEHFE